MDFEIWFWLYLVIGLLYSVYDWNTYQKENYKNAIETGKIESGMLPIYCVLMLLLWPVFMIAELYHYIKNL